MKQGIFSRLAALYARMDAAYTDCAREAGLSCRGCPTNCCTSFFQHHTYVEWIYMWKGLRILPEERRALCLKRAREYLNDAHAAVSSGGTPSAMCPLNENGLCVLYAHRLMICRLHGTRNAVARPDGRKMYFPGCAQFVGLPSAQGDDIPTLDRTPFYRELAGLEEELYRKAGRPLPRVDLTLAEMIVRGAPSL